jgi:hypothetical protein
MNNRTRKHKEKSSSPSSSICREEPRTIVFNKKSQVGRWSRNDENTEGNEKTPEGRRKKDGRQYHPREYYPTIDVEAMKRRYFILTINYCYKHGMDSRGSGIEMKFGENQMGSFESQNDAIKYMKRNLTKLGDREACVFYITSKLGDKETTVYYKDEKGEGVVG